MNEILISRVSKMMGISKNNIIGIFKDKTDEECIELINGLELICIPDIASRLDLDEIYNSFMNTYLRESINDNISPDIIITKDIFDDESNIKLFRMVVKKSIASLMQYINENNKLIKIHYHGKNITSKCSKLPHIPHYDNKTKSFCCGVNGDIEIMDYTIRITSLIYKIRGNRSRPSAIKGGYRIQSIKHTSAERDD